MRFLPRTLAWVAAARAFFVDLAAERNLAHWVSGVVQLSTAPPAGDRGAEALVDCALRNPECA